LSKSFIVLSLSANNLSLFLASFSISLILVSFSVIIFVILVTSLVNLVFSVEIELLSLKYNQIEILERDDNKEVYLGERKEDNKKVVIKQINLLTLDEQLKKKAKKEAKILSNLEHPNLIKYYDFIFEKNKEIIIMEYVEGGNLKEKIEEKKVIEENKIIDWFIEICEGIKYINNKKIIHRNLKNLIIYF
jgi:serine/threonine protein kinase